jgi:hypothetical protein
MTFRKCDNLRICDLWTQLFFVDLKLPQIRKSMAGGLVRQTYAGVTFIPQSGVYEFGYRNSLGGRSKQAFAERDKKHTLINLRGISTNWFKNQLCPFIRLSRLRAWADPIWPTSLF